MSAIRFDTVLLTAILAIFGSVGAYSHFDTEQTKASEVINCIEGVSLHDVLVSPPVPIARTVASFQVGLNWYGMDGFSQYFGVGPPLRHLRCTPCLQ